MNRQAGAHHWASISAFFDSTPRSTREIVYLSGMGMMKVQLGIWHGVKCGCLYETFRAPRRSSDPPISLFARSSPLANRANR